MKIIQLKLYIIYAVPPSYKHSLNYHYIAVHTLLQKLRFAQGYVITLK